MQYRPYSFPSLSSSVALTQNSGILSEWKVTIFNFSSGESRSCNLLAAFRDSSILSKKTRNFGRRSSCFYLAGIKKSRSSNDAREYLIRRTVRYTFGRSLEWWITLTVARLTCKISKTSLRTEFGRVAKVMMKGIAREMR